MEFIIKSRKEICHEFQWYINFDSRLNWFNSKLKKVVFFYLSIDKLQLNEKYWRRSSWILLRQHYHKTCVFGLFSCQELSRKNPQTMKSYTKTLCASTESSNNLKALLYFYRSSFPLFPHQLGLPQKQKQVRAGVVWNVYPSQCYQWWRRNVLLRNALPVYIMNWLLQRGRSTMLLNLWPIHSWFVRSVCRHCCCCWSTTSEQLCYNRFVYQECCCS